MTDKLKLIKGLLEDKKGEDIVVLDVSNFTNIADYFIIATANSSVHAKALADYLTQELKKARHRTRSHRGFGKCQLDTDRLS